MITSSAPVRATTDASPLLAMASASCAGAKFEANAKLRKDCAAVTPCTIAARSRTENEIMPSLLCHLVPNIHVGGPEACGGRLDWLAVLSSFWSPSCGG